VVSTLVTQDLDLSGEQHLRVAAAAVAVDGRVGDVEARGDGDQPCHAACLAATTCRLTVSEDHQLGIGQPHLNQSTRQS